MFIEVAAHQGNRKGFPPNTMPAYESAYDIGADMIECDMHMTKDGEIVMIHDATLDRTTDVSGAIRSLTLDEVRRADAGVKTGDEWRGTRIPTLRELCELAVRRDDKMQFNFEFKVYMKNGEEWAKACADKIISIIDEYGLWERGFINSFDGRLLRYIEEKYGKRFRLHGFYPFEVLGETRPESLYCACLWKRKNPDGTPSFDGVINPKEDFDALIARGIHPWVGASVRTIEDMVSAVQLGARLVTSNDPEYMIAELEKAGLRVKE